MAETERAFARRARETTVRQAFIDFFADESVGFGPDPEPARESLRKRNTPQPPGFELHWEPRLGDVAASGDLGYLTGPAEYINPGKPNTYTCYFSVWKRQADGEFRVILESASARPQRLPSRPAWFARPQLPLEGTRTARASRSEPDGGRQGVRVGHRLEGRQRAFGDVMHEASRLNRPGQQPMTRRRCGRVARTRSHRDVERADEGRNRGARAISATPGASSPRRDPTGAKSSYYIRVWTRRSRWLVATGIRHHHAAPSVRRRRRPSLRRAVDVGLEHGRDEGMDRRRRRRQRAPSRTTAPLSQGNSRRRPRSRSSSIDALA